MPCFQHLSEKLVRLNCCQSRVSVSVPGGPLLWFRVPGCGPAGTGSAEVTDPSQQLPLSLGAGPGPPPDTAQRRSGSAAAFNRPEPINTQYNANYWDHAFRICIIIQYAVYSYRKSPKFCHPRTRKQADTVREKKAAHDSTAGSHHCVTPPLTDLFQSVFISHLLLLEPACLSTWRAGSGDGLACKVSAPPCLRAVFLTSPGCRCHYRSTGAQGLGRASTCS